jgi:DNA-binding transcriptional LysR family regulator
MDRFEAMGLFVAAVEAGSFSAASRKLGVPLPTVSRKVGDLETQLNTRLLVRTTRKLALTDAGATYLAACKTILEQVFEAERIAAGEYLNPIGDLIISAPIVFGRLHLLPVVTAFLASFPDINVQMVLSDRNADLVGDHIDMALRIGALPDSNMVATRVGVVRRVTCASPAFLTAHGTPKTPDDLARLPCVTFGTILPGSSWMFADKNKRAVRHVPVSARLAVNTAEAALDAAIAGIGITQVLSYQSAQAVRDKRLKLVLTDHETEPLPVHVLYPAQIRPPLKLRSFLEFAVPRLRKSAAA